MQDFSPFEGRRGPSLLPPARYWLPWAALAGGLALAVLFAAAWIFTGSFERRIRGVPSKVYSDLGVLYPGQRLAPAEFHAKLRRLGYKEVSGRPEYSVHFRRVRGGFECHLRSFEHPVTPLPARRVQVRFAGSEIASLRDLDGGEPLDILEVEPEQVAAFYDEIREERILTTLEDLPAHFSDALLLTEDQRFFSHQGIDVLAILRAAGANVRALGVVQGGSTLTQQLIKNVYLTRERTFGRKFLEAILALLLELRYTKEEILNAYVNEVYLGQKGSIAITGFGEAARFYFGKDLRDLDLAETALLIGMIRAPGQYNPYIRPARAIERRRQVLRVMLDEEKISPEDFQRADAQPIDLLRTHDLGNRAPYYLDYLQAQLGDRVPAEALQRGGLRVFTSLDLGLQERAERALREGLDRLEKTYPGQLGQRQDKERRGRLQGAVIALRPESGQVVAMVGGRRYEESQFNRAVQARRQPGSLMKPFVYLTGFARSQRGEIPPFTAATLLEDEPLEILSGGEVWSPQNYDHEYHGVVSVREALARSLNIPAVRAARDVGLEEIIETLRRFGIGGRLLAVPSLALGAFEVSPLEVAAAFAAIANYGVRAEPVTVREVVTAEGQVAQSRHMELEPVITPQVAYLTIDLMRGVVAEGTAASLRALGFAGEVAAKTGTTDDLRDAWFVGFTPRLLTLVWVGYDDNQPIGLSGSQAALPIWAEMMRGLASETGGTFREPEGMVWEEVDPGTGQVATWRCPDRRAELFVVGNEPGERCSEHDSGGWASGFWEAFR
jgi:penicillin-binding protein 1B